ncbi:hypothetical protein UFOVP263_41 [uncultured Caudovirales phage]|uniref:Uncharacterized protein n=1 Tax=uncultured Caudovirales phage TaxID=2100421 RepID=A0A6J5TAL0_9CAUD|nr:hypothetical protein UFOVP263_41 [uncultured Caudovirales phage]CAB4242024.1 hypothetical protein UFOVP91_21 [uncultured Caudovirales phage]
MTQAWNLSQLANKVNTSGQLDAAAGLSGVAPTANGGTNNGSLAVTAGGILYTDGSKAVNSGAGTSGYVLTSGGAGAPTWSPLSATGALIGYQIYTASGSYTKGTNNPSFVIVEVVGGGGGNSNGSAGGTTSFGSFVSATGGSITVSSGATAGGTGVSGDFNLTGGYGNGGTTKTSSSWFGGASPFMTAYNSAQSTNTVNGRRVAEGYGVGGTISTSSGGAGGGGGYAMKKIAASLLGTTETVTIGAGGGNGGANLGGTNGICIVYEYK